jgi:adenosylcobinamide-GDP ribazoletransferase
MKRQCSVLIDGCLLALQFFTIIPVSKQIQIDNFRLKKALQFYPLIGLFIGMFIVLLYWLLHSWTPFSNVAIAAILFSISIFWTGGLHLDGWMDSSDAYFSYQNHEKRLEIMRDPQVGAFGVLSVLFLLGWRFLFIVEVVNSFQMLDFFLIASIPFMSRKAMVFLFTKGRLAKKEGLAFFFKQAIQLKDVNILYVFMIIFLLLIAFINVTAVTYTLLLIAVTALFGVASHFFIKRQFGGITGDTLGAFIEGVETFLWMSVWLLHYYVMG